MRAPYALLRLDFALVAVAAASAFIFAGHAQEERPVATDAPPHLETPVPAPKTPPIPREKRAKEATKNATRGNFVSIQVNVASPGLNIQGDAANEPSMAIDPTNPNNIVAGWRQFDAVTSDFRQAGYAYSHDGGTTWVFPGSLQPGQFRSDPVLEADSAGVFYYYSLSTTTNAEMFISRDQGVTWQGPLPAQGGDKNWFAVDATGSSGDGHVYPIWNSQFTCCAPGTDYGRSIDGGLTYQGPWASPTGQKPKWGTIAVGPDGEVYFVGAALSGSGHLVLRSDSLRVSGTTPSFELARSVDLGGNTSVNGAPNPGGLLGQVWVDVDRSTGPTRGHVYVLGSVDPPGADPLDVHIVRSIDGGQTWSAPVRVHDDPTGSAWQWFGTLSVAPDGRLDAVWNDTRIDASGTKSELRYAYSLDQGTTWSAGLPVSPVFDSTIGHPQQNKIGDYYQMRSQAEGAAVIYSATFNGEQDVYFLRVGDCNANGLHDSRDVAAGGGSTDCDADGVPDECEEDCNANSIADDCDLAAQTSDDCDANRIPDECDIASGAADDCDDDGRPDFCTITDDLEIGAGWTAGAPGDTATSGIWVRVDPNGTNAQPESDHTVAGTTCFVTGQGTAGGSVGANDVDGGRTTLVSARYDASALSEPTIGYWRWFSNDQGSSPGTDVFRVDISNDDGSSWAPVEIVGPTGAGTTGGWVYRALRVADFVVPTANVRLRFIAEDADPGSIVEAAIDDITLVDCAGCGATIPVSPAGLALEKSTPSVARLSWNLVAGASAYNVYRGDDRDATDLACLASDLASASYDDDGTLPPAGESLFYVVSATNCAGESTLGDGRVPATPCP